MRIRNAKSSLLVTTATVTMAILLANYNGGVNGRIMTNSLKKIRSFRLPDVVVPRELQGSDSAPTGTPAPPAPWRLERIPPLLHVVSKEVHATPPVHLNSGMKHFYSWTDETCLGLLAGNEPLKRVFEAESHGPYRADICRLIVLYTFGGVYADDDIEFELQPIEFIPANATFVSAFESLEFKTDATRHKNGLFQAFIAVSPANPIMRRAMDLAVKLGRKSAHSDPAFFNTGGPNWGPYITWLALPPDNTWQDEAIYIYEEACNRKELLHRGGPGSACRCGVYDNNSTLLFKSHSSGSVNCAKEMAQPRPRGFFHWNPRT
eukprot:m.253886 g.253886  ORF g.253886 m.253886 type:complete len:320 (+) comp19597_c0_seq2:607-1566(+)